jgi:hypothetical protein
MKLSSIAILTTACCLAGCALPNAILTGPDPVSAGISGNWEIVLNSTRYGLPYPFGIYLTQTGSSVSGVGSWSGLAFPMCVPTVGPACGYPYAYLSPNFTGTVAANGSIVLTSTTSGSNPAVLTLTASATDSTTLGGSFAMTLPNLTDQGPVEGTMIAPLNGTYAGTLVSSVTGDSIGVTTTLSQSGPGVSGFLGFSGPVSLSGVPCIGSVTLPASGTFLGDQLNINLLPANIPNSAIYLVGTISQDAKTIAVNYQSVSGSCSEDNGSGTLTLQ